MNPTRRAVLGGLAATPLAATAAPAPLRAFFVGNSFTCEQDIPGRIRRLAAQAGTMAETTFVCGNGQTLTDHLQGSHFMDAVFAEPPPAGLPDLFVLQDHSVEPLTPAGRQRSAVAMRAISDGFTRPTVLFATWARHGDHPLYGQPGMPATPAEMTQLVHDHYAAQAASLGAALAPVGRAWQAAILAGYVLHNADGYHANETGAHLTALVLASAMGIAIAADDPLAAFATT